MYPFAEYPGQFSFRWAPGTDKNHYWPQFTEIVFAPGGRK
jgi:hypothetical protein